MSSPFVDILRTAIETIPGAVGGAFAARDGEIVDAISDRDSLEWAMLIAHYGIILSHVQSALNTFHYGEAEVVILAHDDLDILLQPVAEGYYTLIAAHHPAPLGLAFSTLHSAAHALRQEML